MAIKVGSAMASFHVRNQKRISTPRVAMAATIWFSVREEIKIPQAIKEVPKRKSPR